MNIAAFLHTLCLIDSFPKENGFDIAAIGVFICTTASLLGIYLLFSKSRDTDQARSAESFDPSWMWPILILAGIAGDIYFIHKYNASQKPETAEETNYELDMSEEQPISEDTTEEGEKEDIYSVVEQMPEFPGGETELVKYLSKINYPTLAKENDIEGSVYIRFVVGKSGEVKNVSVAKGADKLLNNAAVRHIRDMPRWKPGKQNGKEVSVQYIVPIKFVLQ